MTLTELIQRLGEGPARTPEQKQAELDAMQQADPGRALAKDALGAVNTYGPRVNRSLNSLVEQYLKRMEPAK